MWTSYTNTALLAFCDDVNAKLAQFDLDEDFIDEELAQTYIDRKWTVNDAVEDILATVDMMNDASRGNIKDLFPK